MKQKDWPVNGIETFSGTVMDVANPAPEMIKLDDIAHSLGNICRYGGHCRVFYSVAQHAVFCSKRLERQGASRAVQLAALHHDDAEAYLGDIPRPMKPLLGAVYSDMTKRVDEAIAYGLGLHEYGVTSADFKRPEVKAADNWALLVEARHLLPSQGRDWGGAAEHWDLEAGQSRIVTPDYWREDVSPAEAAEMFLTRHKELTNG